MYSCLSFHISVDELHYHINFKNAFYNSSFLYFYIKYMNKYQKLENKMKCDMEKYNIYDLFYNDNEVNKDSIQIQLVPHIDTIKNCFKECHFLISENKPFIFIVMELIKCFLKINIFCHNIFSIFKYRIDDIPRTWHKHHVHKDKHIKPKKIESNTTNVAGLLISHARPSYGWEWNAMKVLKERCDNINKNIEELQKIECKTHIEKMDRMEKSYNYHMEICRCLNIRLLLIEATQRRFA
jgi:hypothetical protein